MSCDCEKTPTSSSLVGLIVCGPCACGKSEVASALAKYYQVPFVDADSFHSEENIKKMGSGIPLTDKDRFPWLVTVRQQMLLQKKPPAATTTQEDKSQCLQVGVVAACSALTQKYRHILSGTESEDKNQLPVIFVFLNCSQQVLQQRLNERQGHFMKSNMLVSQLATLEIPDKEAEQQLAVIVNGDADLSSVLEEATTKLQVILNSRTISSS